MPTKTNEIAICQNICSQELPSVHFLAFNLPFFALVALDSLLSVFTFSTL
jgi:hypothetical protein